MTRTGEAALRWARGQHDDGGREWHNLCQVFVRECFGVGALYGSATLAWNHAAHKHPTSNGFNAPRGVPYYWTGGSHGYGHVVISAGGGLCWSTDINVRGGVSLVRINDITRRWGQNPRGWTEDINRVRIWTPRAVHHSGPVLDLSNVREAQHQHTSITEGSRLKKAVAAEVGQGQMDLANNILGAGFTKQYAEVQRKFLHAQRARFTAHDVNGIVGRSSLSWLGHRHGFSVKS